MPLILSRNDKFILISKALIYGSVLTGYILCLNLISYYSTHMHLYPSSISIVFLLLINLLLISVILSFLIFIERTLYVVIGVLGYIISYISIIMLLTFIVYNNVILGVIIPFEYLLFSMILFWVLLGILIWEILENILIFIKIHRRVTIKDEISAKKMIKSIILTLSTKYTRLLLSEIIEETKIRDKRLIRNTIQQMIQNEEVYGQYFSKSDSVVFDQQANIKEIDSLMAQFTKWESEQDKKKI